MAAVSGAPVRGDQAGSFVEVTGCSGAGVGQAPDVAIHTLIVLTHALTHSHSPKHTLVHTHPYSYTDPLTRTHSHPCKPIRAPTHTAYLFTHVHIHSHTYAHAHSLAHRHTRTGSSSQQDPSWGAPVPRAGSLDTGQNRCHPQPALAQRQAPPDLKSHQLGALLPFHRLGC